MTMPPQPPMAPGAPPPKQRPGTVTGGAILTFLLGALALVWAALTVVSTVLMSESELLQQIKSQQQPGQEIPTQDIDAVVGVMRATMYGSAVVLALFGLALLVLGFFVWRGSRGARITTWVVTGLFGFCGLCGSLGSVMGAAGGAGAAAGVVGMIMPVLALLLALGVIILLALPESNEFFRKPTPAWEPPAEYLAGPTGQMPPPPYGQQVPPSVPPAPGHPTPPVPPPAAGGPVPPPAPGEFGPPSGEQPGEAAPPTGEQPPSPEQPGGPADSPPPPGAPSEGENRPPQTGPDKG